MSWLGVDPRCCSYYEGKEFEVKVKTKVPGQLSDELKVGHTPRIVL